MSGRIVIVGTPLGNLSDFPPRAVEALKGADVILCEDTRHSRKLLTHFGIDRPLESYHDHNEAERAGGIIDRVANGVIVALISDAGMPVISDPGFRLIALARERALPVEVIPGPFAGVMALAASGIAPLPFSFLGFTPHRRGERLEFYRSAARFGSTIIVYESPERVLDSLADAQEVFGDAPACLAREMTKLHEEYIRGSISELIAELQSRDAVRGEITLVFGASVMSESTATPEEVRAAFERLRDEGMRRNDAIKAVAERFGLRRNDVYRLLVGE